MKKALLLAPMGSVHKRLNKANINALLDLGYEVHLLANFNDGDEREKNNSEYVKTMEGKVIIHSLPFRRHSLFGNLKYIKAIKNILVENDFSVVHAHTETGGLMLRLCSSSLRKRNTKLFFTPHGMSFYKGSSLKTKILFKPLEKWICKIMDHVFCINQEEVSLVEKWNKGSAIFVHGIGIDFGNYYINNPDTNYLKNSFGLPANSKIIVSIGELDENKNHATAIKALATISRKDIYYIICGVGHLKNKLVKLAERLGVANRVIFAGFRDDISEVLYSSNCLVFPSFHEGLPITIMEAMFCGCPIVCSEIRGNVELIQNKINGYTAPPRDYHLFAKRICQLLDNNELRQDFVIRSKQKVQSFSIENVRKELLVGYE